RSAAPARPASSGSSARSTGSTRSNRRLRPARLTCCSTTWIRRCCARPWRWWPAGFRQRPPAAFAWTRSARSPRPAWTTFRSAASPRARPPPTSVSISPRCKLAFERRHAQDAASSGGGGLMRPNSILAFERLFLCSIALSVLNFVMGYEALVETVDRHPTLVAAGIGSGAAVALFALGVAIYLLLWFL